jgi:hypothetical protein
MDVTGNEVRPPRSIALFRLPVSVQHYLEQSVHAEALGFELPFGRIFSGLHRTSVVELAGAGPVRVARVAQAAAHASAASAVKRL